MVKPHWRLAEGWRWRKWRGIYCAYHGTGKDIVRVYVNEDGNFVIDKPPDSDIEVPAWLAVAVLMSVGAVQGATFWGPDCRTQILPREE
jgi:hypothetical protein